MPVLEVLDGDTLLTFTPEDLDRFHGSRSPAGVAHAFKVLELALPRLGAPPLRREVRVRTAFGGPGARDAFECVLRAVSEDRYEVDRGLRRPRLGPERERFVFDLRAGDRAVTLVVRDGIVRPEFAHLAFAPERSAEQDARLEDLKREMAARVRALPPEAVYEPG